jgi:hypothetical protein
MASSSSSRIHDIDHRPIDHAQLADQAHVRDVVADPRHSFWRNRVLRRGSHAE